MGGGVGGNPDSAKSTPRGPGSPMVAVRRGYALADVDGYPGLRGGYLHAVGLEVVLWFRLAGLRLSFQGGHAGRVC